MPDICLPDFCLERGDSTGVGLGTLVTHWDAPFMSQKEAVEVTQASNTTLDLWVRDGVIEPYRLSRRERLYSVAQLISIDLIHLLVDSFRLRPLGARDLALQALEGYRPLFAEDVADLEAGRPWHTPIVPRLHHHLEGFTRDVDGSLRRSLPEDDPTASVMIALPTQPIARRVLHNILRLTKG